MKKIKTLFERVIVDNKIVDILPNVAEGCEWVLKGEGVATRKLDGTACLVQDGVLYARLDKYAFSKRGEWIEREIPEGAIPCQENPDPVTGHHPFWVPVDTRPEHKWHREAFKGHESLENGTYELIGEHFRRNPEGVESGDILVKHGSIVLEDVPRTFEGIRAYLKTHEIEGIVFHRGNGDMCKIKRSDFGFIWNPLAEGKRSNKKKRRRR